MKTKLSILFLSLLSLLWAVAQPPMPPSRLKSPKAAGDTINAPIPGLADNNNDL
jgi:hypothetical protein